MKMISANVTRDYEVVLPSEVRTALGLTGCSEVIFEIDEYGVVRLQPGQGAPGDRQIPSRSISWREMKAMEEMAKEQRVLEYIRKMDRGDA